MTAIVTRGDAANLQLPDESVDLIVTSPPYFGLRSYTDGGAHYTEQIGAEATVAEYLDALMACTAEWMRVLKPSGSMFVNLGDKYNTYSGNRSAGRTSLQGSTDRSRQAKPAGAGLDAAGYPNKSLLLLPERYRIRAVDELGLIARAVIVWDKPNGLPESIRDRVRRSHEDWVHLTKRPRYFSSIDVIREPHTMTPQRRTKRKIDTTPRQGQPRQSWPLAARDVPGVDGHPLGKLPGSVWTVATQPLKVPEQLGIEHFAAFPMEWPRRLILGWSPHAVCTACGEGRRPVVAKPGRLGGDNNPHSRGGNRARSTLDGGHEVWQRRMEQPDYIAGWTCGCADDSAPAVPGVVLDPFGGTGTTALVADVLGRVGISNDLSADYCRLARWRVEDDKQRARAGEVQRRRRPRRLAVRKQPAGGEALTLFGDDETAA